MNKKNRFRRKALTLTTLAACSLFFAASCQKQTLKPEDLTQEELESINQHVIDYALQVIPDIHDVMPTDLIKAMDSIPTGNTLPNGQPEIISALHFGDNPPTLYKDSLGFVQGEGEVIRKKVFIPSDSTKIFSLMQNSEVFHAIDWFRFYDQHRGIAKFDFKHVNEDHYNTTGSYYIEYANVIDSVFIMGENPYFTAFFTLKRLNENSYGLDHRDSSEYFIISGKVTAQGVKELYYGVKIKGYDHPTSPGYDSMNYNDIAVFYIDNLPFTYWDPSHHYNN